MYLTTVLHQDLKTAAKSCNYWSGVTTIMPLLGGFLADAYLGRFSTVMLSSLIYIMGLLLLTMSRVVPGLRPLDAGSAGGSHRVHEVVFFLAMYLISVGTGGHKPSLESFGADQFDDDHPIEKRKKMSFFNWWCFGLCCGLLLGVTVIVYIQDHVGWAVADIILTTVMVSTTAIIWIGRPLYRYRKPMGSPLTPMMQVIVAAFVKRRLPYPVDSDQLYEIPKSDKNQGGRLLLHTNKLRFLDKAAIVEDEVVSKEKANPWRLASVTKVEEVKLIINMIPIWLTTLPFGICVAQSSTFFIKQSTTLNRAIAGDFTIPPASVYGFAAVSLVVSIAIYDRILVPFLRRVTGDERGINILQRIGIGMVFSVATMVVAALVERKRLRVVEASPAGNSLSMSVFWLAPQYVIIAVGDCFTLVGLQEYFYDQVPDSMRSLGIAFYLSVLGASSFLSGLLITVVDGVTARSWFGKDLNASRLDYFYWLLAGITAGNLFIYSFVAQSYSYKNARKTTLVVADCYQPHPMP
ncbi:protein NRT1/ PTR FAMILY 5.7-like isoform X2 [Salvia miltiorrhiza]|nr:protein NRT1/ PTR FAMILY 5.7-like isoform X2 [Salvia miltiorrhiza]